MMIIMEAADNSILGGRHDDNNGGRCSAGRWGSILTHSITTFNAFNSALVELVEVRVAARNDTFNNVHLCLQFACVIFTM